MVDAGIIMDRGATADRVMSREPVISEVVIALRFKLVKALMPLSALACRFVLAGMLSVDTGRLAKALDPIVSDVAGDANDTVAVSVPALALALLNAPGSMLVTFAPMTIVKFARWAAVNPAY